MTILNRESSRTCEVRIRAPYELTRTITIKPKDTGKTVLEFFRERFPYLDETVWRYRLDRGWIHENGIRLIAGDRLRSHQVVRHYSPSVIEPSVAGNVSVIQETADWLIVYKPAPLPMHQGGRYYKNTLIYILEEMGYPGLRMVHRLDSVTSGLVIFARNKETAIKLRKEFEENRVEKTYHALVKGEMREEIMVNSSIRRKRGFVFECGEGLEGAKAAVTHFIPEKVESGKTLVRCIPETGRTHQIRLHLRHAGFPIADDPIYGPDGDQSGKRLQNSAISLQSSGIVLRELGIRAIL
ncbi:MAG: RluA family pseudouridine synthase [Balneolaceae bacterium]|nr:MAG: RluA family pseudouridine synthase [Balneolaceae bacterium]